MDTFTNPSRKYRGTDLWMLNDYLETGEIDRQLREMKDKGTHCFIARTFIGLKSDYPGKDFKSKVAAIIDSCKKYDMKLFLQACYMPGGIPDLPDEYAHMAIMRGGDSCSEQSVQTLQNHNGIDYWLVRHPCFLDMLSADAVKYYIRTSYADMWDDIKNEYGKTVLSIWVDEPHFSGKGLPWTSALPDAFERMWGYSIIDNVYLLFEKEEGYATVRYHYWRTVLKLLQNAYFMEVSSWCRENNLLFSGHLMYEDNLFTQIAYTCDCMPMYKYFDIPGIDFLTSDLGDIGYRFVNTPLQCSSAAHQAGRDTILCEMFGVSTENLTFAEQKYLFDHFAALGVNHKMIHGIFYSLRGRRKRAYPPHIGYQQPYWEDYGLVNDYFVRVSWFISRGCPVNDALVIHPVESAFAEFEPELASNSRERDGRFNELLQKLLGMQASFELGDEETIQDTGSVSADGRLNVGQMSYRTVILADLLVIRQSTLSLLEAFARKGGRIILMGSLPSLLDGRPDKTVGARLSGMKNVSRIRSIAELKPLICTKGIRHYVYGCAGDPSQVIINCRNEGSTWYYFIFNGDHERTKASWLAMDGTYTVERWMGEDGSVSQADTKDIDGQTRTAFKLEAGGSIMLVFSERKDAGTSAVKPERASLVCQVRGGWSICRQNPNSLLLEYASYRKQEGGFSPLYPILAIQHILDDEMYTGPVTLRFPFTVDTIPNRLMLAVENPGAQSITVNGVPVSGAPDGFYVDKAFETLSVPPCLHTGENAVEIRRDFSPLSKPQLNYTSLFQDLGGVELEPICLVGDFGVVSLIEPSYKNCIRLNRNFSIVAEPDVCDDELTTIGYPFYVGTIGLSRTISIDPPLSGRTILRLNSFRGCVAEIRVNGRVAGKVTWAPYEVEITGMLQTGANILTIFITNTLRNLLGPFHRPAGDLKDTWGDYSSPDDPWMGAYENMSNDMNKCWYDSREPDTDVWTEGYMQAPFGLGGVTIEQQQGGPS